MIGLASGNGDRKEGEMDGNGDRKRRETKGNGGQERWDVVEMGEGIDRMSMMSLVPGNRPRKRWEWELREMGMVQ